MCLPDSDNEISSRKLPDVTEEQQKTELPTGKQSDIETDDIENLDPLIGKLDLGSFKDSYKEAGLRGEEAFSYYVVRLAEYLASKGRKEEAIQLILTHPNRLNTIRAYSTVSVKLLTSGQPGPREDAFVYLDSALTEYGRIQDFFFLNRSPRIAMVLTPAMIGGKEMIDLAQGLVRQITIGEQDGVIQNLILGTAMRGDYYQAYTFIPELTIIDRLTYFNDILSAEGLIRTDDPEWKTYLHAWQTYWILEVILYEPDLF